MKTCFIFPMYSVSYEQIAGAGFFPERGLFLLLQQKRRVTDCDLDYTHTHTHTKLREEKKKGK